MKGRYTLLIASAIIAGAVYFGDNGNVESDVVENPAPQNSRKRGARESQNLKRSRGYLLASQNEYRFQRLVEISMANEIRFRQVLAYIETLDEIYFKHALVRLGEEETRERFRISELEGSKMTNSTDIPLQ